MTWERILVLTAGPPGLILSVFAAITTDFSWWMVAGMAGSLALTWWSEVVARRLTAITSRLTGIARGPCLWWWARTGEDWALKIAVRSAAGGYQAWDEEEDDEL